MKAGVRPGKGERTLPLVDNMAANMESVPESANDENQSELRDTPDSASNNQTEETL